MGDDRPGASEALPHVAIFKEKPKVNQQLRLQTPDKTYSGVIISVTEEAMVVATSEREDCPFATGSMIDVELAKDDGIYHFSTRMLGHQLAPVLIFVLSLPRAMRRVQRRKEPRHPVQLPFHLIYISTEASFRIELETENVSLGGLQARVPAPIPTGKHCVVVIEVQGQDVCAISRIARCDVRAGNWLVGLGFVEMSRADRQVLGDWISYLGPKDGYRDSSREG